MAMFRLEDSEEPKVFTRTITLYECPEEFIMVDNGRLVFRRDGSEVKVSKGFLGGHIHVGCHTLTKEAWKLLKKQVDGT